MYAQVEKSKENKSRTVANSVAQKKRIGMQGFGFVDNRHEVIIQRKLNNNIQQKLRIEGYDKVIQGNWKCKDSFCGAKGSGKPKKKCPDCGGPTEEDVSTSERKKFGIWWEELGGERRQELLRQHGSHEAYGGQNMGGYKGGGKKGNQHDNGVATAMEKIREEYENGEYD